MHGTMLIFVLQTDACSVLVFLGMGNFFTKSFCLLLFVLSWPQWKLGFGSL